MILLSLHPLWTVSTTTTSNGSVNAMHNSPNPLTVLGPLAEHLLFVGH